MSNAPTTEIEYPDHIDSAVLKIAGVVVLGSIMSILDITVVNVALPTFQRDLDVANYSTVAWTVTAYTLALAAIIPVTGWAADRFGTKRLFMAALALFTLGSVLCAVSWSIGALIAFRVVQGLGGGMLMPLGMTIMTRAAGPKRIGRLMAVLGVPMLLGPILGPILGGWLIDIASWHWVFLINLPLGAITLVYAAMALPADQPQRAESFDTIGMLILSPGLAALLYGISAIPEEGSMTAPKVMLFGSIGVALIIAFVVYSFRPKHPLLDLRLYRNYNLSISSIVLFMFAASFFGGLLLIPTYFQNVRGESAMWAGMLTAPQGIGAMLTVPIAGALADKMPVGRFVPAGLAVIGAAMFGVSRLDADTSYAYLIVMFFIMGLGMGFTMMPTMTSALRTLAHHEVARGTTLLNITQQVASSVGVAVMSVLLTNQLKKSPVIPGSDQVPGFPDGITEANAAIMQQTQPDIFDHIQDALNLPVDLLTRGLDTAANAFHVSLVVAAILCGVTFLVSLFMPKKTEESHLMDDEGRPPVVIH